MHNYPTGASAWSTTMARPGRTEPSSGYCTTKTNLTSRTSARQNDRTRLITHGNGQWVLHNQVPPRQLQDAVDHVRKAARSCFLFGQRRNASTNEKIYHSRASAALFLRLIENLRPNFITVNDDWPTESDAAYAHAIQPFPRFLSRCSRSGSRGRQMSSIPLSQLVFRQE